MTMIKLIRDKLNGLPGSQLRRVRDKEEHSTYLVAKLYEEVGEVAASLTDPEEYGDVFEALTTLAMLNGVDWSEIQARVVAKHKASGGFTGGLLMAVE